MRGRGPNVRTKIAASIAIMTTVDVSALGAGLEFRANGVIETRRAERAATSVRIDDQSLPDSRRIESNRKRKRNLARNGLRDLIEEIVDALDIDLELAAAGESDGKRIAVIGRIAQ